MMKMKEFNYLSANGKTNIHAVKWTTDKKILGIIQLAHEVTEYILRYKEFAKFFTNLGFVVVGNDHLSHRKSLINNIEKDIPILLISGGSDPVENNGYGVKKVYKLYKKANISDVTLKIYPNLRHDILRETNSKNIMEYIYNWIKEKSKLQDI